MRRIITVGLAPAWDITCRGRRIEWGQHKDMDEQVVRAAGKALNISCALAWLGRESAAMGLWGREDYKPMAAAVRGVSRLIRVKMTAVAGRTRQNVTLVDTAANREMHLRSRNNLISRQGLQQLKADLQDSIYEGDICVFAGAMPGGELLGDIVRIVETCREAGALVAVDSYGPAFKTIVKAGLAWLIKPNVEELRQLLGIRVKDETASLARAGRGLVGKVEVVLMSRGEKGAVMVTRGRTWTGRAATKGKVLSTVGCGDYLLAGFLKGLADGGDELSALEIGLKVAAARAWGWTETRTWPGAERSMRVAGEPVCGTPCHTAESRKA